MSDTSIAKKDETSVLKVIVGPGQDPDEMTSAAILSPEFASTTVSTQWCQKISGGKLSLSATVKILQNASKKMSAGDMSSVEARLLSQATALDVLFAELSRRAAVNLNEYPESFERYMKLALKAQNQSRMTLETLGNIKNPPAVFAKQANINNGGQQQINNGVKSQAPARENENEPSKLLEKTLEQRMDAGTQNKAGGSNPQLATVESFYRPEVT